MRNKQHSAHRKYMKGRRSSANKAQVHRSTKYINVTPQHATN